MTYRHVIVGGGVHGTYFAGALRRDGWGVDDIRIIEPQGRLLAEFERKCGASGMRALRSPFVHHVAGDPFDLERYAAATGRDDELIEAHNGANRPTTSLFFDHANAVIDRLDLDETVVADRARDIRRDGSRLRIETTSGSVRAENCLVAVGGGCRYRSPEWVRSLPDGAPVAHVWTDRPEIDDSTAVCVVGGGITAVQTACDLAESAGSVTLCSRRGLSEARIEADPTWMNWRYIRKRLHGLPPGSRDRLDAVREARYDGTVPGYVLDRLRGRIADGDVIHRVESVLDARPTGEEIGVRTTAGSRRFDALVLATGFDNPARHPLVEAAATALDLERGAEGYPVLCDDTLAWKRRDGRPSNVAVSGVLAELSVGPYARNIVGARRAAERIIGTRREAGGRGDTDRTGEKPEGSRRVASPSSR
ncbi:FAD/NAD(P)-binding protein [Haloferacaceae archaeon DSL9]